jgi:succinate dehydrogenase/fumarate reductase flavoprotein subunit
VPGGRAYNLAWQDWLNLQNQATVAWLITKSALERAESRGSHHRRDFPEPSSELYNVYIGLADAATPKVWTEPVRLTRLGPEAARKTMTVEVGD